MTKTIELKTKKVIIDVDNHYLYDGTHYIMPDVFTQNDEISTFLIFRLSVIIPFHVFTLYNYYHYLVYLRVAPTMVMVQKCYTVYPLSRPRAIREHYFIHSHNTYHRVPAVFIRTDTRNPKTYSNYLYYYNFM